ncbi:DUF4442 domain-containing protein [Mycolicibacterium sp.]|uniref:DUF4442 domain-containing protein n=1 Tax=Mycolicibacterium sp. TaxID=2320850 RepID=UPI003D11DDA3
MTDTEAVDFDAVRTYTENAFPFKRYLGITFPAIDRDGATAALPERPELLNHVGTVHAGALFTVAEGAAAGAFSGGFASRADGLAPLVRTASIAFRKPARGRITGSGRIVGDVAEILDRLATDGRVSFDIQTELRDADGVTVVEATFEYYLRASSSRAAETG